MAAKPETNKTISGHSADIRSSDWLGARCILSVESHKRLKLINETDRRKYMNINAGDALNNAHFKIQELGHKLAVAKSELKASMSFEDARAKIAERTAELERENARLREALGAARQYISKVNADYPNGMDDERDEMLGRIDSVLPNAY